MSHPLTDDDCAQRLRNGDETAFRMVMDRYFPVITHFALRIVRDRTGNFQSVKAQKARAIQLLKQKLRDRDPFPLLLAFLECWKRNNL